MDLSVSLLGFFLKFYCCAGLECSQEVRSETALKLQDGNKSLNRNQNLCCLCLEKIPAMWTLSKSSSFLRFSYSNVCSRLKSFDANACLNGSKSRLLKRDNLFSFRSRYVRISRDPINKCDNVEIDTDGSVGRQSSLFSSFCTFTESAFVAWHTFQGFVRSLLSHK